MWTIWTAALLLSMADAKPPKDLSYQGPAPYVPVVAGDLDSLARAPACVDIDTRGVPDLESCPGSLTSLYEPCEGDGLLCAVSPTSVVAPMGIVSFDPAQVGKEGERAFLALDHGVTGVRSYRMRTASELDGEALLGLADTCADLPTTAVVTEVFLGCGKTLPLPSYAIADGPMRIKGGFQVTRSRGEGAFVTDLDRTGATLCVGGDDVLIAVRTQPLAHVCASVVLPEAVGRLRAELGRFTAAPSEAAEQRTSLLVDMEKVRTGRLRLVAEVEAARGGLTMIRSDLGRTRLEIEVLEGADDDAYIELLTELERISTDISESFVDLASVEERAGAVQEEAKGVAEKISIPHIDAFSVSSLERRLDELQERGQGLYAEFRTHREKVDSIGRAVGFLHGRVSTVRGDR